MRHVEIFVVCLSLNYVITLLVVCVYKHLLYMNTTKYDVHVVYIYIYIFSIVITIIQASIVTCRR